MTTTAPLLDELQRRGFTPHESGEWWFDLDIGSSTLAAPRAKVRVEFDDNTTIIYVLTGNSVLLWDADLSHGTPPGVVTTVIDLAIAHAVTMAADG